MKTDGRLVQPRPTADPTAGASVQVIDPPTTNGPLLPMTNLTDSNRFLQLSAPSSPSCILSCVGDSKNSVLLWQSNPSSEKWSLLHPCQLQQKLMVTSWVPKNIEKSRFPSVDDDRDNLWVMGVSSWIEWRVDAVFDGYRWVWMDGAMNGWDLSLSPISGRCPLK